MITKDGSRLDFGESKYWPLSIDCKITNYCEHCCSFCHESSGINGKHADIDLLLLKLSDLPKNTEIALGGGNPCSHPDLQRLIDNLGCIVNMTIRDKDIPDFLDKEITGITALGISISEGYSPKEYIESLPGWIKENMVAHLILGITSIETYREVKKYFPRILWLGFKKWGRNKNSILPDITEISKEITRDMYFGRYDGILAFDNLAITQLDLKSKLLKSEWESFYLGPEFSSSMYIDAVKGEYSGYSTSDKRLSWDLTTLQEYYVKNHTKTY